MNNRNRGFSAQPGSNRCNVFNINNQNIFINFQPIINKNVMNSMNNQKLMMLNSQNEFNNMGGAQNINFLMNNNMNLMNNNMNQMNKNMNPMYNNMNQMNMFNNRYDKNNNMMNINMNNCCMNNNMDIKMNNFMSNNMNNNCMNNNVDIRMNRFMKNPMNNNCMNNNMGNRMNNNMNNNIINNNCFNINMKNRINNNMNNNCMNNNINNNCMINNFDMPNIKPVLDADNKNNNFAFPFRKSISNEIKEMPKIANFLINNNHIKMRFSFQTGQNFDVYGKPYDRLIDVINRFEKECPEMLKKLLKNCICNGKPADRNKTLSELEIKNGGNILFVENKHANKGYRLTQKEEERYSKYKGEFYALKILNKSVNNNNQSNSNELKSYSSFYNSKDKDHSVSVKEHNHLLVYCLTNFDWKCNLCLINYEKSNGRYYCSKCDFNICENCHYNRNYIMKKSFPKDTFPSNLSVKDNYLNTDLHEHPLIYCRISKNLAFFNDWNCSNCCGNYNNNIWSFYCTVCNYHLCLSCCGYK